MKQFYFMCLMAAVLLFPHFGTAQQTFSNDEVYQKVIRIKFKENQTAKLDAMLQKQANEQGIMAKSGNEAYLRTGISAIDQRNAKHEAVSMKRVFRPAGKFEARHRAWGLHLWYEVYFNKDEDIALLLSSYQAAEVVEKTEPVFKYALRDVEGAKPLPYVGTQQPTAITGAPNDPRYSEQWGYAAINAEQAWQIQTGDSRVVVAIEDQGVDYNHPDLAGNMWTNQGETPGNGIDDDNNGYVDDYYGYNFGDNKGAIAIGSHGTHVGGTVAAETNNGLGVAGVAGGSGNNDGVRLMSLSVFGASSQGGFDEAFVYAADNGAVISQNSWGGGSQSTALENAIDYFIANAGGAGQAMQGGLAIFAAGNDNSSSTSRGYPASYAPTIAVASITSSGKKSSFSNYGSWVDISAPGSSILSTYPNSSYNSISGTSMACPHVSGVAALVVSHNYGNITAAQARQKLESTASDVYTDNPNYQGQLGSGVVDAYAALTGTTPPPPPPAYCNSKGNNVSYEWIANVTVGSLNNSSGANGGYGDFTSKIVQMEPGGSYNVSLSPGFAGTTYQEYFRIWIDLNGDLDFGDAGELVFDAGSTSNTTVTGTITIPASTASDTTRMRVSMKYNGAPGPCETFSYGEVEDYTVIIGSGGGGTCDTPGGLTASNVTHNSATLNWSPAANANSYDVRYRPTGSSSWTTVSSPDASVNVSGLAASTTYEFQVRAVCSGGTSNYAASVTFTTKAAPANYCASKGNNTSYEYIDLVQYGGFSNPSGRDGYKDNTNLVATVARGSSTTITFSAGFTGSSYREYWRAWIDFNQDGDFADTGEQVVNGYSSSSGNQSATITIPAGAALGTTRMRISMKYGSYPSPCETFTYGEVEDYSVNITSSSATTALAVNRTLGEDTETLKDGIAPDEYSIHPNPAADYILINNENNNKVLVKILTMAGAELQQAKLSGSEKKLNISRLAAGTYILIINDGQRTFQHRLVKK